MAQSKPLDLRVMSLLVPENPTSIHCMSRINNQNMTVSKALRTMRVPLSLPMILSRSSDDVWVVPSVVTYSDQRTAGVAKPYFSDSAKRVMIDRTGGKLGRPTNKFSEV